MINHARTLLLNVSGLSGQRQEVGEEYLPAAFRPLELPSYIQGPRRALFGVSPDRYFLNFRARELMAGIHQTELAEYVYQLDPRVTYWPEVALPFYDVEKRLVATQYSGVATQPPFFRGDLFADHARGRSVREFNLRVTFEDGPWEARLRTPDAPGETTVTTVAFDNGISQEIPLGNTGVSFRVPQPTMATDWAVYTRVRPSAALVTAVPVLEMLGEPLFLELFGVSNSAEPYATFKQLWFEHPNAIYRLAGLTLAMIYRTDEILKKGSQQAA